MVRIFHTADIHVGLKFTRGYPEALQKSLVDERIAVLSRMAELANQNNCDLFVIAGDLFDHLRVSKKTIRQTAEALRQFEGIVAVLPGNHDYKSQVDDPIWPTFKEHMGEDGTIVLERREPYDLNSMDLPVVLLPGVCTAKHSDENAIGWIKDAIGELPENRITIGIAHGSLDGITPDFNGNYYPMQESRTTSTERCRRLAFGARPHPIPRSRRRTRCPSVLSLDSRAGWF